LLLAASEVVGFAKTGGLADVAGALPAALARHGHDCAVILPLYRCVRTGPHPLTPTEHRLSIPIGPRRVEGRLWRSVLPVDPAGSAGASPSQAPVPVFLVEQADYFERDDPSAGRGLYQYTDAEGRLRDYHDNSERFIFFCRAILEAIRLLNFWPDVLHLNDWQTGLVPVYLREEYARRGTDAPRARYQCIGVLFTIHNIAYQGNFSHWDMVLAGLDWRLFNPWQLEFYGRLSFLKAGLIFSDLLNTVSPTYAKEIQTFVYGCGMQGVLMERHARLFGIVNGADYRIWDPQSDPYLPAPYSADALAPGKPRCKAALQEEFQLVVQPDAPLLAVIARLVEQKGIDLILPAAQALLREPGDDVQLVVLGHGDPRYHQLLQELQARYPGRVGLALRFDEKLAHRIEAGADLFLMPSLYEPSGLNQLYSMKYGTPPVVRATGGLADTVVDTTPATLAAGTATGFSFTPYAVELFLDAIRRGLALYRSRDEPEGRWHQVVRTAMRQDWSWDRSAREYEGLYQRIADLVGLSRER
jgi:starch synthase